MLAFGDAPMDVKTMREGVSLFRRTLALIIFGIVLIWPIFHIALVKNVRISSWRLFGWGMYATPTPETQSRLRVVILNKHANQSADIAQLHDYLTKNSNQEVESRCINLFIEESEQILRRLPLHGLCRSRALGRNLAYFMNFGSFKHLTAFVNEALSRANQTGSKAYAFLTHQRFNIFKRTAYLESDVFKVSGDKVQYWGKINSDGEAHEEHNI